MIDAATVGIVLVFVGLAVVFIGALGSSSGEGSATKGGAVVLLGPIPIAFGTDAKWTSAAIVLAIILVALTTVLYSGLL